MTKAIDTLLAKWKDRLARSRGTRYGLSPEEIIDLGGAERTLDLCIEDLEKASREQETDPAIRSLKNLVELLNERSFKNLVELLNDWRVLFSMQDGKITMQIGKRTHPYSRYDYECESDKDTIADLINRAHAAGEPPKTNAR